MPGIPEVAKAWIDDHEFATIATLMPDGRPHLSVVWIAQIVSEGVRLGVDFGLTVSCYNANAEGAACGHCDACRLRAQGFDEAGVADPTHYA